MSHDKARTPLASREHRAFLYRKLHSLSGVIPVGFYLVLHLWTNAKAMQGQQVFDDAVSEISHTPYLVVLEALGIWIPILFHGIYGIKIALEGRPNASRYPYSRNWMYTLQRITGIVAFAFIAYHFWELRVQVSLGHMEKADFFQHLCSSLSSTTRSGIPVLAIFYLVGVAAAVFHFANGLYGFCFSWGITVSRRATRIGAVVFGLFGLALFVMAANTVIFFATGSRLVLAPDNHAGGPPPVTCRDLGHATVAAVEQ